MGKPNDAVWVNGIKKGPLQYTRYKVIKALLDASPERLAKDDIENVYSGARRMLRELRRDADWQAVIHMPGKKGHGGYWIG